MLENLFRKSQSEQKKGRFIVIDGPDGTGKTTQANLLIKTLQVSGYLPEQDEPPLFDFPQYGTASSILLERYLAGEFGNLNPEATSILYSIDRFDASFKLRAMLNNGKIIIANRYVSSNAGHQGAKIADKDDRIKFYKWLDKLEYITFGIPRPDLTIILHIPFEVSWEMIQERSRKNEDRPTDIHETDRKHLQIAEQVYLEYASLTPNTKLVECYHEGRLLNPEEVHAKIWELVRRITLKEIVPRPQV